MASQTTTAKTVIITAKPWTKGPVATDNGINIIIEDMAVIAVAVNDHAGKIDWSIQEIKKLQEAPPGAGVSGVNGNYPLDLEVDFVENGFPDSYFMPARSSA